jgi:hypothetical protein
LKEYINEISLSRLTRLETSSEFMSYEYFYIKDDEESMLVKSIEMIIAFIKCTFFRISFIDAMLKVLSGI